MANLWDLLGCPKRSQSLLGSQDSPWQSRTFMHLVAAAGVGTLKGRLPTKRTRLHATVGRKERSLLNQERNRWTERKGQSSSLLECTNCREEIFVHHFFYSCIITLHLYPLLTGHRLPRFGSPGSVSGCQGE